MSGGSGRVPAKVDDEAMELLETYASEPRRGILSLVSRYPSSVTEIGKEIGLEPVSVRFHLRKLLRLNLVEEVKQKGALGRPRYLYRATKRRFEVAFPRRDYMQLASVLLDTLAKDSDQDRVSARLRVAGAKLGSELGRKLKEKEKRWDGFSLRKHFVHGLLEGFGEEPETVACSNGRIQYRVNNCPFMELAVKYPEMICEQLDDAVNSSLLLELDQTIDWRKLKCAGHGDGYCEYVATFPVSRRKKAASSPESAD